jgi:mRNA-degrading endonuclease toxin of MazEF toxin-antitoxin module
MSKNPDDADLGDIFIVDYPQSGGIRSDHRPAVIISCATHNKTALDVVMMQISKEVRHASRSGAVLIPEWQTIGLHHESVIKPLIVSLPRNRLGRFVGTLSQRTKAELRKAIEGIFGA